MTLHQFGPETDEKLNELSTQIGEQRKIIDAATQVFDEAWAAVFDIFDEFAKEGKKARFVAKDGFTLHRRTIQPAPKLDEQALLEKLTIEQWHAITERRVNTTLLEAAVQAGAIDAKIVDQCLTVPEKTYGRYRSPWTKEETNLAKLYREEDK